jgi:EAL domain-containing protein (putative c-di-GMP-specific phosphodiesterase class I)
VGWFTHRFGVDRRCHQRTVQPMPVPSPTVDAALADLRGGGVGLRVVHQPIVAVADGTIVAVEALVRWDGGDFDAAGFTAAACAAGLCHRLTSRVVDLALADVAAWSDAVGRPVTVAVNVTPDELAGRGLVTTLVDACDRHAVAAGQVCVEITEGRALPLCRAVDDTVRALRGAGFTLAVDDYGVGHADSERVLWLRPERVKTDRSLLRCDRALADAVDLAATVQATVTVEGVETPGDLERLARLGVHHAQGFLFSPPVAAVDAAAAVAVVRAVFAAPVQTRTAE